MLTEKPWLKRHSLKKALNPKNLWKNIATKNLTRKNPRDFFYTNELKTKFPPKTLSQEKKYRKSFEEKVFTEKTIWRDIVSTQKIVIYIYYTAGLIVYI